MILCLQEASLTVEAFLTREASNKDLRHLSYVLSIEVAWTKSQISLCHEKYVLDILEDTGLLDAQSVEPQWIIM